MLLQEIEKKNYPTELLKNREMIEGNIIACLYANTSLFDEYKELQGADFISIDGLFYFGLAYQLREAGYKIFDAVTISTYLSTNQDLKKLYDTRGGYRPIQELISIVNLDNADTYYDNLVKSNILLKLHDDGFNVLKDIKKFERMNSEQVYGYMELMLNDTFIKKQVRVRVTDLTTNYDSFIEQADSGINMGISYAQSSPILNYTTSGIHEGITLVCAYSGGGKTSFITNTFILPLLENNEKILLMINEQTEQEWRSILLTSIISSKLHYYKFNRKRFQQGHFTDEEKNILKQAQEWLKKHEGNLLFVQMFDYNIKTIKKLMTKYSKLGFTTMVYDTYKNESLVDTNNPAWATMVESSKELFQVTAKNNIKLICTMQLAGRTLNNVRYLTNSCLSGATGVAEVCNLILMLRDIWQDEYTDEKKDLKCYNFLKSEDGKYTKTKQYYQTNLSEKYSVLFVTKNRWGDSDIQLLYRKNLAINTWTECGYCLPLQY